MMHARARRKLGLVRRSSSSSPARSGSTSPGFASSSASSSVRTAACNPRSSTATRSSSATTRNAANRADAKGTAGAGDCVDCLRCVQVCPTGIDIRQGLQMECIGCTACIDACDAVMTKLKRPRGLIRYDSRHGFEGKAHALAAPAHPALHRPRAPRRGGADRRDLHAEVRRRRPHARHRHSLRRRGRRRAKPVPRPRAEQAQRARRPSRSRSPAARAACTGAARKAASPSRRSARKCAPSSSRCPRADLKAELPLTLPHRLRATAPSSKNRPPSSARSSHERTPLDLDHPRQRHLHRGHRDAGRHRREQHATARSRVAHGR